MKNLTEEEKGILKHSELYIKWLESDKTLRIEAEFFDKNWGNAGAPSFSHKCKYREAKQPLYTNIIGEEIYEGDAIYWFSFSLCKIVRDVAGGLSTLKNTHYHTESFKSRESLQIYIKSKFTI